MATRKRAATKPADAALAAPPAKRPPRKSTIVPPTSVTPNAGNSGDTIRVRMYRVGFGDFFLLTVPGVDGPAHILMAQDHRDALALKLTFHNTGFVSGLAEGIGNSSHKGVVFAVRLHTDVGFMDVVTVGRELKLRPAFVWAYRDKSATSEK